MSWMLLFVDSNVNDDSFSVYPYYLIALYVKLKAQHHAIGRSFTYAFRGQIKQLAI